jgi:CheY-like chemotaxis protein
VEDFFIVSSVKDTGIGIKPEDLQKLFSAYNQVDTKTNRTVEGTGLGLAITKKLVEMMDGTIRVESKYGKGSEFHVRLRQEQASNVPIGKEVVRNLTEMRYSLAKRYKNKRLVRANLSYAHVLVVDDIATNIDVIKGMLKPYSVKIACASNGSQAIEMIQSENPRFSAVFMDHMMPGMDGIEATRIIREEIGTDYARHVPIIALTANAIVGNEDMFLSNGFQAFISKPIDVSKLDFVLRRWVRDKTFEKKLWGANGEEQLPEKNADKIEFGDFLLGGITINGIDIDKAIEHFGRDEKILANILSSYAANTPALLNNLHEFLETGNLEDYTITVHGIKGSSYGIFALEAGQLAEDLELFSKAGELDIVKAKHPAFSKRVEALIENIQEALTVSVYAKEKPKAASPDPLLLQDLRKACATFDMDRIDATMEQLEAFQYEHGEKIVAWLREQVNKMNLKEISNDEWAVEQD